MLLSTRKQSPNSIIPCPPLSSRPVLGSRVRSFAPGRQEGTIVADHYGVARGEEQFMAEKINKSDAEWRQELTPEQYAVLRQKGTEQAFTGEHWNHHEPGVYRCAGCGMELF